MSICDRCIHSEVCGLEGNHEEAIAFCSEIMPKTGEWQQDHEILKAYSDGANEMLDKIRAEIKQLPTNTRTNWDGCCPDFDYPEIEYVDVTKNRLLEIIDKYKAESEE